MATDVKQTIVSDCHSIEMAATTLVALPHFAAQGVNHSSEHRPQSNGKRTGSGLEWFDCHSRVCGHFADRYLALFPQQPCDFRIPLSNVGGEGAQAIDELDKALVDLLALSLRGLESALQEKMRNLQVGLVVQVPAMSVQNIKFCQQALNLEVVDQLTLGGF
ncbi:hypothetical protein BGZ65_005141, partial [Modicella reniformis]